MLVAQCFLNIINEFPRSMKCGRNEVFGHVRFVRKVDPRLDQRQCRDQPLTPGLGTAAKRAGKLPHRLYALRLGLGKHEVGEALDRGQVELAVATRGA